MSWNDGPLQSWYDVHEALRNELKHLQALAADAAADDGVALTTAVTFFLDLLLVHSSHEDAVVFPFMQRHGIDIPARIRDEHHAELALTYDIRTALIEIHALGVDRSSQATFDRVRAGIDKLADEMLQHIAFEDEALIPQCEERLSIEDQQAVIKKLVGETPHWIRPRLMAWMFSNMSVDHAVHLLRAWASFLPADAFHAKTDALRDSIEPARWEAFVQAVPSLSRAG